MNSNEILQTNQQDRTIDFHNAVGLIYNDSIYINKKDCLVRLELSLIRNIYFKKEKALTGNIFLLSIGLFLVVMLSLTEKIIPLNYNIIGYISGIVALVLAFLLKFNKYKIIITTINSNIISTTINTEYREEGLELVTRIRNNINKENSLIRAV
jgi:hypothetical protein